MIGVRLNSFNDNSPGEPEQDANSALTELDKGLRSGKVGEQCEAIVRFPRLFEKYPFPILINSSFLKLADVFRLGNNFLRLWVLRVCQQSEKHLDKILNIDEFVRRVFSVLHSNDPVARALALQTLGAVAGIIPERQNVHHAIRCGLDSHDNVEVDAAIYATTQFAAQSNAFAVSMCNKLSDMVVCEATGAERRARLVRALRTVHGGAVRAHGVLRLLRALMARFPSASSVRAAIAAITAIAADTVVHVPDQVELLLNIAVSDARWGVRRSALFGLRRLAEHAALWPLSSAKALVDAATSEHIDNSHMLLCLEVLEILVRCPAVCAAAGAADGDTQEAEALRKFCSDAALSRDLTIASTAATVLTSIAVHCYQEAVPVQGASELLLSLESLVIITGVDGGKSNVRALRRALKCLVQLCFASPAHLTRTARVIGAQLKASSWDGYSGPRGAVRRAVALLEALGALGGSVHCTQALMPAMPAVVAKLREAARVAARRDAGEAMEIEGAAPGEQDGTALVMLCTVVCQERAGAGSNRDAWEAQVVAAIEDADGWTQYRVGRAALRYGHHNLASGIFSRLASLAPTEAAHRWLTALQRAAAADAMLAQENGLEQLEVATAEYSRAAACVSGGAAGGAAGTCAAGCGGCSACVPLAACYVRARAAQLAALTRAAAAAHSLCTQPPPAIAHSQAQAARDMAARCGACAGAVRRATRALADCRAEYARIASTAFDADAASLRHIHILQHTCNQLTQLMERITTSNYQERQSSELSFSTRPLRPTSLEDSLMLTVCDDIAAISAKLFDSPDTKAGISHRHMEALLAAIGAVCARPAGWPRAVAVRAPPTRCRLALTPAPRAAPAAAAAEHAVPVPHSHHLALKIEGVIQPAPVCKGFKPRPVQSVQLTVTAVPHPRNNDKGADIWSQPPIMTAVQTVTPVRDFFSAQQLVAPGAAGLYAVAVQAAFVDDSGTVWNTGPRVAVNVKVHEDPTAKSTVQVARARF